MYLTPNLKLKKPLTVEKYDVNVFNSNCDTVDSAVSNIIAGIENNTKETDKAIKELKENKADTAMVGAANGIAPLDSNRKIPPVNIPFGTIAGTCFEGNMGKKLRDEFNSHINEFNSHTNQSDASFKELENNLATETERAVRAESTLREDLSSEAVMARNAEKENADAISAEIRRAQAAEEQIEGGLNLHMQSASTEFKSLHDTVDALEVKKANKTDMETALAERYTKDQTFSRQEVLDKIEALIGSAPDTLDTFREIADALGNDPNFATTIMEALSGKVDKENGKALSSNDYSNDEKAKVQASYDIRHSHSNKTVLDKITQTFLDNWTDSYNKRHEHSNKGVLDGITSALITAWNSAVTHISDAVKHITAAERTSWNDADSKKHTHDNKSILDSITQALLTKWNSVDNKVDKVTGKGLSTNDYTTAEKQKLAGISTGAEVNSITGVKGNAESSYRIGNVNLTPENIGAAAKAHASSTNTYGVGTSTNYGHLRLSEAVDSTAGVSSGIAATPYAVKKAYDLADGKAASNHTHTKDQISDMPTKLSQFSNDTGFITAADVDTSQNHDHANKTVLDAITQTTVNNWNSVTNKVDKVSGKGLSTNDFTTALLSKLNGIADGAQVNSITGIKGNSESSYRTGNVNLTPANIGAAASSHTHTKSQITDMPTAMKNPASLIIQTNGTNQGSYDGSSAKTINITAANVGAATSSHSHSAYENQNAFSNITVGSTTLAADSMTDTLTLVAGNNITLTPDVNNDKITIAATGGSTGNFASKSIYGDSSLNMNRKSESSVGPLSFAFGRDITASGDSSHAEGWYTVASGTASHAEGGNTTASEYYTHSEGYKTVASGRASHSEGESSQAAGYASHAEGYSTIASGKYSHAEGVSNGSVNYGPLGFGCHAEGYNTKAGLASATSYSNTGAVAHAEGNTTTSSGNSSHAEGNNTTASGNNSHTEGYGTLASDYNSHAEGNSTTASGSHSHAEGNYSKASAMGSHAEGSNTTASGIGSHAEGSGTIASNYASNASGKYNASMTGVSSSVNTTGTAFAIGNGTSDTVRSNAFSVMYTGVVKAKSTITGSTTADYAELFEWMDGNPENKDNAGYFVTLDGDRLKYASEGDYILGVISGEPFVLGNSDCDTWNGMYLRDNFNRVIYERAPMTVKNEKTGEYEEVKDADGNTLFYGTRPVLNPDYDPTEPYVSRIDRAEWDPVGMLGVLSVYDDGTCEVNGYCKCNNDAIATKSDTGYRVIKRVADNIVRIIFR